MNLTDLCDRAAAALEAMFDEGRDEARSWLELLSNRQLQENIRRTKWELEEIQDDRDLLYSLPKVLKAIGVPSEDLSDEERAALLQRIAGVHLRIDLEDVAYQEELLERRRRSGIDSIVGEIVGKE